MAEPLFDSKRAALIIRDARIRRLHELQQRILLVERFGKEAVVFPGVQTRLGSVTSHEEMLVEHARIVQEINKLNGAIDAASDVEAEQMVRNLYGGRRRGPGRKS